MSDFLVTLRPGFTGDNLGKLLHQAYPEPRPAAHAVPVPWGAAAVLDEAIAAGHNLRPVRDGALFWVGELMPARGWDAIHSATEDFVARLEGARDDDSFRKELRRGEFAGGFNGACAAVIVGRDFACVFSDPMATVPVYVGTDDNETPVAVGSQSDLVARCLDSFPDLDSTSIAEFLNLGTPCWPYTMHRRVTELAPGQVHVFRPSQATRTDWFSIPYWAPPAELDGSLSPDELAEEFRRLWTTAVTTRSHGRNLGAQLSGGLDSRLVLAAVPSDTPCTALTLCDGMNRETRIARRVAKCYQRPWKALIRDPEYLAQTAPTAIRFTGCEQEWHHAHSLGFASIIRDLGIEGVLSGLFMDNNLKGYFAKDLVRVPRLGGLRPPLFRRGSSEYIHRVSEFCQTHIRPELVQQSLERRTRYHDRHFALQRSSPCEWLDGLPITQVCDNGGWIADRRLMPLRLPVVDRPLLDFALRVPAHFKLGEGLVPRSAAQLLGRGRRIPNANDGVRPGSGSLSRLAQRGVRRLETSTRRWLARAGVRVSVPHSWHDYQAYWQSSAELRRLGRDHASDLAACVDNVLTSDPRPFLNQLALPWRVGFRLIQMGLWRSILRDYRLERMVPAALYGDLER